MKSIVLLAIFVSSTAYTTFSQPDFSPEIKRVAVFKNGYAFTFREAQTQTKSGWAYTSNTPIGVLGTIWGYST